VPKWFSRSGNGSTPFFLWDNTAYALGLSTKEAGKTARDHAAFKTLHFRELAGETDAGLCALRRFLEWWDPSHATAHGIAEKLLDKNVAFRLRGEARFLHQRPASVPHIERLRAASAAEAEGFSLIRGQRLPLVRLHPKVKGIDGAASAEIPLVSFNNDAFASYGKEQGFNAPTSEVAAFRYGAALNALLQRGGRNRLRIADATVTFWADASKIGASDANAETAETLFSLMFEEEEPPASYEDASHVASVRDALEKVAAARAQEGVRPDLVRGVAFHVLGLAPNAARVAVRFWLSGTFAQFTDALDAHARALGIAPSPWGAARPKLQRLLVETTALQRKYDNIPVGLAAEVARAVLTGTPYPRAWLTAAIIRLRAGDDPHRGWHAAAIKACLSRMSKETPVPTGLDPDNPSQGY
jgi:CRISPR-associated protein Csd1